MRLKMDSRFGPPHATQSMELSTQGQVTFRGFVCVQSDIWCSVCIFRISASLKKTILRVKERRQIYIMCAFLGLKFGLHLNIFGMFWRQAWKQPWTSCGTLYHPKSNRMEEMKCHLILRRCNSILLRQSFSVFIYLQGFSFAQVTINITSAKNSFQFRCKTSKLWSIVVEKVSSAWNKLNWEIF